MGLRILQHDEASGHVVVNAFLTLAVVTLRRCIHYLEPDTLIRLFDKHEISNLWVLVSIQHVLEVLERDEIGALLEIDELISIMIVIVEGQFVLVSFAVLMERNSLVKRETEMAATMVLEFI